MCYRNNRISKLTSSESTKSSKSCKEIRVETLEAFAHSNKV